MMMMMGREKRGNGRARDLPNKINYLKTPSLLSHTKGNLIYRYLKTMLRA